MKTFKSFIKRYWLIIWVVIAALSFAAVGTVYAAFTKSNTEKVVLARVGKTGKLFRQIIFKKVRQCRMRFFTSMQTVRNWLTS